MPNLSQILKAEISRISRREAKAMVGPVRQSNTALKQAVWLLKSKVLALETENRRLLAFYKAARENQTKVSAEQVQNARLTARTVRAMRRKMGLSRQAFGKLVGITGGAVFMMEQRHGRLRLRQQTLVNLLSVKGMGRREAKKRLDEVKNKAGQGTPGTVRRRRPGKK